MSKYDMFRYYEEEYREYNPDNYEEETEEEEGVGESQIIPEIEEDEDPTIKSLKRYIYSNTECLLFNIKHWYDLNKFEAEVRRFRMALDEF